MKLEYDYLIVGAGLSGCVLANLLAEHGKKVLLIDRQNHIGGFCYSKKIEGIEVHMHGAHIFNTSNEAVWKYVNKFTEFTPFINSPIANYKGEIYNLPFNMNTFSRMWGVSNPDDAKRIIELEKQSYDLSDINSLEKKAISLVGETIYKKLVKEYTEKQWNKDCSKLSPDIISVLPLRFTYDNNYFNSKYQGIPSKGYTNMLLNMIDNDNITLSLSCDFEGVNDPLAMAANKVIYTGRLDRLFDFKYGYLEYRGVAFENKVIDNCKNYQGVAVVNYTSHDQRYTRTIEHRHFDPNNNKSDKTIISYEYSIDGTYDVDNAHYAIYNERNNSLHKEYLDMLPDNFIACGVHGDYKLYNMSDIIERMFEVYDKLLEEERK